MMAQDKGPETTYSTLVTKCIPYNMLTTPLIRVHEQLADMSIDHAKLEDLNSVRLYDGIMSEDDDPPTDHRNNSRFGCNWGSERSTCISLDYSFAIVVCAVGNDNDYSENQCLNQGNKLFY
ncbi:hypothetical protein M3Y96_00473300 [Aphelenchoides besseyi]|nr:hypothetical protein M3Y96_00473300 [Aphelenchoides besseyi]